MFTTRKFAKNVWMIVALVAAATAQGESRPGEQVQLALRGGGVYGVDICGKQHPATVASEHQRVLAAIRVAGPRSSRKGRRVRLVTDRCNEGRWRRIRSQPFDARRRFLVPADTGRTGDYRLRAAVTNPRRRGSNRSRPAYLRISPRSYESWLTASIDSSGPGVRPSYSVFPVVETPSTVVNGQVSSKSRRCVADRVVGVYRTTSGEATLVGTTRSDPEGDYWMFVESGPAPPADYYATAPKQGQCAPATSPIVNTRST
jgi:hypothetical protein